MSFFRYPGGKNKLSDTICQRIMSIARTAPDNWEYREPFFGGGSIGLALMKQDKLKKVWFNDKDVGIACLWNSVYDFPDDLKKMVRVFKPSVKAFDDISELLRTKPPHFDIDPNNYHGTGGDYHRHIDDYNRSVVQYGFYKLAIHQISYSGLGLKSGGPLGGRSQESAYKIDCRWSPNYICKKIDQTFRMLYPLEFHDGSVCSSYDFSPLIRDDKCPAVIYLDPPYYDKGSDLYYHAFTEQDHERLAKELKATRHKWVLSYDDCPKIRKLYDWANVEVLNVNYSITSKKVKDASKRQSRWKNELLITAK